MTEECSEPLVSSPSTPCPGIGLQSTNGPALTVTDLSTNSSGTPKQSRWVKLRGTIKVANAVAPPSRRRVKQVHLTREDSFLKRFSTRHGGTPYGGGHVTERTPTGAGSTNTDDGMRHILPLLSIYVYYKK